MSDLSQKATPATLRLRVTTAAESAVRSGHPWVFADSIRGQNRPGQLGELAVIYDRRDQFLAIGLFDPQSPLRVRVVHRGKPTTLDGPWWLGRLRTALGQRDGRFDDRTTGYRLVYGEGDGWPGLVLDRYGSTLVMKLYAGAWLPRIDRAATGDPLPAEAKIAARAWLPRLPALLRRAGEADAGSDIQTGERLGGSAVRHLGIEDGRLNVVLRLSRNLQAQALEEFGLSDGQTLCGDPPTGCVTFLENGLRFEADVVRGQKTGFFLDQRENREIVGTLARDRDVLNVFSFSGGFSLYAARGGARSVTDLDVSAHALDSAARNFALNRDVPAVAAARHERVRADAFDWLEQPPSRQFGLVVLDPPSLAKRETERAGALEAYLRLNALALRWLAPGGVLMTASCSAHVTAEEFYRMVRQAARDSDRRLVEMRATGHPPDHPATFREGQYLKALYLQG